VKRASEEELMDLPFHAQAYANADFSEPNSKFVVLFSEKFPAFNGADDGDPFVDGNVLRSHTMRTVG
jgi:hypothetical protein